MTTWVYRQALTTSQGTAMCDVSPCYTAHNAAFLVNGSGLYIPLSLWRSLHYFSWEPSRVGHAASSS